jgi:hypothetical protein
MHYKKISLKYQLKLEENINGKKRKVDLNTYPKSYSLDSYIFWSSLSRDVGEE